MEGRVPCDECDESLRSLRDSLLCECIDGIFVVVNASLECVADDSIVAIVVEGVVDSSALFVGNSLDQGRLD